MAHPATKKRGGNPDVKHKPEHQKPKDAMERKLEQGLEESMAGPTPSVSLSRQRLSITKRKRAEEPVSSRSKGVKTGYREPA